MRWQLPRHGASEPGGGARQGLGLRAVGVRSLLGSTRPRANDQVVGRGGREVQLSSQLRDLSTKGPSGASGFDVSSKVGVLWKYRGPIRLP